MFANDLQVRIIRNIGGLTMKFPKTGVLCLILVLSAVSCAKTGKTGAKTEKRLVVSVTFNAIKEMAQAVGGDKVEVSAIIPDGLEPHDFEPKAQDMAILSNADVFVFNGLGMEAWASKAVESAGNKKLVSVDSSKGAEPIRLKEGEGEDGKGGTDPHLWLSLKGAEIQARNIEEGFAKADPENAQAYKKNAEAFVAELEKLFAEYEPKMKAAKRKAIITGHAAFGYLCRDFGLEQNSVEDVFASGEPTAKQLSKLVDFAKSKKVKTIFAEELASPAVSDTLARELGAKVVTIYTIESAEDGLGYAERMRKNLEAIYASLAE
jgi:zinc transport system substrate-binding protein